MENVATAQRQTKYCLAIRNKLKELGHATNAELRTCLCESFPALSPTTVHRATTRLASRDIIAIAPSSKDGSMCYDAKTVPHDHFQCSNCGMLKDADIKDKIAPIIESSIDGCSISGRLTINGTCKKCLSK